MSRGQEMRQNAKAKAEEARQAKDAGDIERARGLLDEAKDLGEQAKVVLAQDKQEETNRMLEQTNDNVILGLPGLPDITGLSDPNIVTLAQDEYDGLLGRLRQLELANKQARVKEITGACLTRGVPPAVVAVAERVLMACETDAQPTIKLSADAPGLVNLFGAVVALVESVPGRLGERTYGPTNGKPPVGLADDEKPITVEQAEKIAKERRIKLGLTKPTADASDIEL